MLVKKPLPPHFSWGYVGSSIIQLSWGVQSLAKLKADTLKLVVKPSGKSEIYKVVDFQLGEVICDGLDSGKAHDVVFEPIRNGRSIFIYIDTIRTLPKGKLIHIIIMCNTT